jgi:hypothetical protein
MGLGSVQMTDTELEDLCYLLLKRALTSQLPTEELTAMSTVYAGIMAERETRLKHTQNPLLVETASRNFSIE